MYNIYQLCSSLCCFNSETISSRNIKSISLFRICFCFCLFSFQAHVWFSCRIPLWTAFKLIERLSSCCANRFFYPALFGYQRHFGCTGRSFVALHTIFRRAAFFVCEGRQQQQQSAISRPPATVKSTGANFPPLGTPLRGFAINVKSALRESDWFVSCSRQQRASSRPPKQSAISKSFFISSPHVSSRGRILRRWRASSTQRVHSFSSSLVETLHVMVVMEI